MKDNDELIREVKHEVRKFIDANSSKKLEPNLSALRLSLRDMVTEFLYQKTERRPMVLPVIIEV